VTGITVVLKALVRRWAPGAADGGAFLARPARSALASSGERVLPRLSLDGRHRLPWLLSWRRWRYPPAHEMADPALALAMHGRLPWSTQPVERHGHSVVPHKPRDAAGS
jgi:hypothetical protein